MTLSAALHACAADMPNHEAFRFVGAPGAAAELLSFAALDRQACGIAAQLQAREATGRPVLLLYPSGLAFIAALYGCFRAGAIAVPVPMQVAHRAFERVPAIARDAAPALGLTLGTIADAVATAEAEVRALPWLATDRLAADDAAQVAIGPDTIALLQYTSGTTAAPRGVVLTHGNILHNIAAMADAVRPRPDDRAVSWLPMYHDMGLMGFVLGPVVAGMPCTLLSPLSFLQRPLRWLQALSSDRGTISGAPCFAYDLCLQRTTPQQRAALDLSRWRVAFCGAEVVRPEVLEGFAAGFAGAGFAAGALVPAYGLAEATLLATCVTDGSGLAVVTADAATLAHGRLVPRQGEAPRRRLASCGHPLPGQSLAIVDPALCERVPDGDVGEIWLQSGSVAHGYWRQPEATAQTFRAVLAEPGMPAASSGPWLRTGDLGAITPAGLIVTGRRKDLIIVRGVNYDPLDIETAAAASHAALPSGGGCAFPIETEDGERVVLVHEVERCKLNDFDGVAATAAVTAALAHGFGLTLHDLAFVHPGSLPRTTSGKLQRQACRSRYLSDDISKLAAAPHPALGRWRPLPVPLN